MRLESKYQEGYYTFALFVLAHKGWNDPPTFSYDSFQQNIGKKSQLTKRPDYTVDQLPNTTAQEVRTFHVSAVRIVQGCQLL